MKKKVRIKSLPKAQFAGKPPVVLTPEQQDIWRANQNMFGVASQQPISGQPEQPVNAYEQSPLYTDFMGDFENKMEQQAAQYAANPLRFNQAPQYSQSFRNNYIPPSIPQIGKNKFNVSSTPQLATPGSRFNDIRNQEQTLREGEVVTNVAPNIAELQTSQMKQEGMGALSDAANAFDMSVLSGLSNIPQGVGFVPFIQSEVFSSLGRSNERRQAQQNFRNRFLADAMYNPLPSDYSGMRGDYVTNQGLGINFRPDEAVYGQFGKIAQYGGQMKRKIKITGLPQQAYGGTQNRSSIDEMYPYNSNVRRATYSDMLDGDPEQSVKQYAEEVPREIANIEAEKGETIVKPLDNGLLGMYKIGGKRHYEGGTPLQATPNDFIFSDTKDMKIKDPAILESFGMSYKKGGYTPAKISKKFNLNDPNIQKTLNDPKADLIARTTAERMYDNNLSQLGKLALVQEGRKGFPQGAPDISMPYMQKVGMDPSMFMPDVMTPQDASFQMGKAQYGQQGFDPSAIYGSDSYITRYGKPTNGKVRVMIDPNAPYEDKVRLAEEATATKFGKDTKAPIQQGRTKGYKNFYAGLTPVDFEKRYLEGFMDIEDIENLTPVERRKKLFSELGINASDAELNDPKLLYNNEQWLKNTFYPAFKKKLPQDQFRSEMKDDFMFGLEHFDSIPKRKTSTSEDTSETPDAGPTPGKVPPITPQKADPGKYYIQDLMNTSLAAANRLGINKYLPYDVSMPAPALMDPTFYDPSRELAATGEMANMVTQNLSQFAGPQALSSASQIQSNAAKSVADILTRYNNLNVGVANQSEQANKAIINDFNLKRALAKSNYYDRVVTANQQTDNSKLKANANLMQQATNAITNKAMTQVLNNMYPEYAVDPTVGGEMMYVPSQRTADGSSIPTGNPYSDVSGNIQALRKQFERDPDFQNLNAKEKLDVLAKFMPKESSMTRRYDPRDAFFANLLRSNRRS